MKHGKCKLCLQMRDLQNSHLMAAALYKKSRTPTNRNPNPLRVTARASVQTSHQLSNFVFCKDCEDRFNKNGERYVLSQVYDGIRFPLLDTMQTLAPSWRHPEFGGYDVNVMPSVDRNKLGYFALSVFWRASAHIWREPGEEPITIDLGAYNEPFRLYLLGQAGFPKDVALLVVVCTDKLSHESFYPPNLGWHGRDRTYTFMAKGINFMMAIGKQVPSPLRNLCAVTGAGRMILSRDCKEKVGRAFDRLESQQKEPQAQ